MDKATAVSEIFKVFYAVDRSFDSADVTAAKIADILDQLVGQDGDEVEQCLYASKAEAEAAKRNGENR